MKRITLSLLALTLALPGLAQLPTFTVRKLNPDDPIGSGNGLYNRGIAINNSGVVAADSFWNFGAGITGGYYPAGSSTITPFPNIPGALNLSGFRAAGITNTGVFGGSALGTVGSNLHGVIYSGGAAGTYTDVGILPGFVSSQINAVASSTLAVGISRDSAGSGYHGMVYSGGGITDIGVLPGDTKSWLSGVNASGTAVGFSGDATSSRPISYAGGTLTQLALLPGATGGVATSINASGVIVGSQKIGGVDHGVVWVGGVPTDLGSVGGVALQSGAFVGDSGWIIAVGGGTNYRYLWKDGVGYDIAGYIDPITGSGSGWQPSTFKLTGLNSTFQLTGSGVFGTEERAFVLTAVAAAPEPSSLAIFALGGLCLWQWRRRAHRG